MRRKCFWKHFFLREFSSAAPTKIEIGGITLELCLQGSSRGRPPNSREIFLIRLAPMTLPTSKRLWRTLLTTYSLNMGAMSPRLSELSRYHPTQRYLTLPQLLYQVSMNISGKRNIKTLSSSKKTRRRHTSSSFISVRHPSRTASRPRICFLPFGLLKTWSCSSSSFKACVAPTIQKRRGSWLPLGCIKSSSLTIKRMELTIMFSIPRASVDARY